MYPVDMHAPMLDAPTEPVQSTAIDRSKLKTKICRHWTEGFCPFGPRCAFAHGDYELLAGQHQAKQMAHAEHMQMHYPPQHMPPRHVHGRGRRGSTHHGPHAMNVPAADVQHTQGGSIPITYPSAGGRRTSPKQRTLDTSASAGDDAASVSASSHANYSFRTLSSSSFNPSLSASFFRYEPYACDDEFGASEVLQVPAEDPSLRTPSPSHDSASSSHLSDSTRKAHTTSSDAGTDSPSTGSNENEAEHENEE